MAIMQTKLLYFVNFISLITFFSVCISEIFPKTFSNLQFLLPRGASQIYSVVTEYEVKDHLTNTTRKYEKISKQNQNGEWHFEDSEKFNPGDTVITKLRISYLNNQYPSFLSIYTTQPQVIQIPQAKNGNVCSRNQCGNKALCREVNNLPQCYCPYGYEGDPLLYCTLSLIIGETGITFPSKSLTPAINNDTATSTTGSSHFKPHHSTIGHDNNMQCKSSKTTINQGNLVCANQLIFEESFDSFNSSKWNQEIRFADKPDFEFVMYVKDNQVLQINQSLLKIRPTLSTLKFNDENFVNGEHDFQTSCTGIKNTHECSRKSQMYQILPPVVSGRINTKNKFSFKYGIVEIRAKLPTGDWIYPELFLSPAGNEYGQHYDSGQMCVAHTAGNGDGPNEVSAGLVLGTTTSARATFIRSRYGPHSWANAFHTFVLEWQPNLVRMIVDGEQFGEIRPPRNGFASLGNSLYANKAASLWQQGTEMAPFDQEFYLDIGVGVGGERFPDSISKPWRRTDPKAMLNFWRQKDSWFSSWGPDSLLQIDYIKVYAL